MDVNKQLDDEDVSIGECSSLLISLPEFVVIVSIILTGFFLLLLLLVSKWN